MSIREGKGRGREGREKERKGEGKGRGERKGREGGTQRRRVKKGKGRGKRREQSGGKGRGRERSEGRVKEKDNTRPDQEPFHHGKQHKFLHFPFLTGKALCCHFTWQRVGNGSCPYDRSALHKDKNTWICFTISILVPCRKGYFRLSFEGLLKAGTLQCS